MGHAGLTKVTGCEVVFAFERSSSHLGDRPTNFSQILIRSLLHSAHGEGSITGPIGGMLPSLLAEWI